MADLWCATCYAIGICLAFAFNGQPLAAAIDPVVYMLVGFVGCLLHKRRARA